MSGMYRDRVKTAGEEKRQSRFRLAVQLITAALINGYAAGFPRGRLFTGKSKLICVPVLNCYSCPGALGACPIGAMQAVAGGSKHKLSFYVLGTLMLFGTVLGRLLCGFFCPFGLVQDLLHKIPSPKPGVAQGADRLLRYVKYVILAFFVFLLPAFRVNEFGMGEPWFCKYICPAGTLEGGVPHLLVNGQLRRMAGGLFTWKLLVLLVVMAGAVLIERFFCRYFCPLGAFYSLFNRFSIYQMYVDENRCIGCGRCESVCPMAVKVTRDINCGECIRCGRCKAVCPVEAVGGGFVRERKEKVKNC